MLRFQHPLFFLLLLLLPLLFYFEKKRRHSFVLFSSNDLLPHDASASSAPFIWIPWFIRMLALVLIITALARPQLANVKTEISSEGVDIMLTLDTSGSMQALDFKIQDEEVDRLTAVKGVVVDFIKQRISDRIGMVVFGEMAYTQCPLTLDYDVLLSFLDEVEVGAAGDATAIGDALALSVKRLKDLKSKSKIIILLTDGKSNAGKITPEKGAELAATFGIKVYTIGIGTKGLVPYPQKTMFGMRRMMVQVDIDEETLEKIANTTGGKYFHASNVEGLKEIYSTIDQMEKSEAKVKHYQEYQELYLGFLIGALVLLLLELVLRETKYKVFP
ncbi:MAG: VWA domain-containing protein [Deltaproteobacteria bacterium]|nr:VWA domain-containing protein [Deltaproteobacteria bacterium]